MAKGAHGMETKDHYYLSKNLAGAMQLGKLNKILFILGNLIPDINPFSYITDAGWQSFLRAQLHISENLYEKRPGETACWQAVHLVSDRDSDPLSCRFLYQTSQ